MQVLVINCGSSSLRFQLINTETKGRTASGHVERIGAVSSLASVRVGDGKADKQGINARDHGEAISFVLDYLLGGEDPVLKSRDEIQAVGHRVVHGGEQYADSVLIDERVIEVIRDAFDLAPLHNPANLKGILAARSALPNIPHVAVFDTAFHQTIEPRAYLYALPNRLYRRHRVRRYGFHGTSHYYVSRRLYEISDIEKQNSRVIACHLGNGASAAAIKNGSSVDTSMGLTPLEGLVMGTRSGDIDPSIIFYLVEKEELSLTEVHSLLNRYSGLLGLSGYAGDMRDLINEAQNGDPRCRTAIEVFCYRVKKYIGEYTAVLNGCDAVIFTGGIGENSPLIRAQICAEMENLGIVLDPEANDRTIRTEGRISSDESAVQVWVIPTNEELVIALDALKIAQAAQQSPWV